MDELQSVWLKWLEESEEPGTKSTAWKAWRNGVWREVGWMYWPREEWTYEPGSFIQALIRAAWKADDENLDLLAKGFPEYVNAVKAAKTVGKRAFEEFLNVGGDDE